jgi:hypothetical protein
VVVDGDIGNAAGRGSGTRYHVATVDRAVECAHGLRLPIDSEADQFNSITVTIMSGKQKGMRTHHGSGAAEGQQAAARLADRLKPPN